MSIVKMKKLRLLAIRSQQEDLLRDLMILGCLEISDPQPLLEDEELSPLLHKDASRTFSFRNEQAELLRGVKLLDEYAPVKTKLLSALPQVSREELLNNGTIEANLELSKKLYSLDEKIKQIGAQESRQKSIIESLTPWNSLDIPLSESGTKSCVMLLGSLPTTADLTAVSAALEESAPESQLFPVSDGPEQHYVCTLCLRSEERAVTDALRSFSYAPLNLSGVQGTAAQAIAEAQAKLDALGEQRDALAGEIASYGDCREEMKLCADRVGLQLTRSEAADKIVGTESAIVITGWVPAPEVERFEATLNKFDCAWELEDPDPENYDEVPILQKNNVVTEPYTMISDMYSKPTYNTVDPNPFIMATFPLFFGIMLGDMGYGLIMILVGLIVLKKKRPRGTTKSLMQLCIQCGIATFIMGFLTGGLFGDAVSVIGNMFGKTWTLIPVFGTLSFGSVSIDLPLDMLAGNNPLYVLIGALCIGVIHLAVGVGINVYINLKQKKYIEIVSDLSWWVIFAGIAVYVFKETTLVIWIGIALMVISAFMKGKGLGRFTSVFSDLYNGVTGYLGDILSYSRLMALMLATFVIASVFNQLGSLGGILLFIPVFLIGHALNFGLNLIGSFVHTMRLQFLEFFGKWYREGGVPFKPLKIETNFVDIKEEQS